MKVKSLEGVKATFLIAIFIFLFMHSGMYLYTSSGAPYFEPWLLLQSCGITLIFMVSASNVLPVPSNFYKTDGNSYLFFNNKIDLVIKILLFIMGSLLLGFGIYLQPENAFISTFRTESWFSFVIGILIGLGFILSFVMFVVSWFKNKNDKLILDTNQVHCFDTEIGEKRIDLDQVKEIEFSDEIIKFIGEKEEQIDLSQMSLQVYSDKIRQELTKLRPEIKVSKTSD